MKREVSRKRHAIIQSILRVHPLASSPKHLKKDDRVSADSQGKCQMNLTSDWAGLISRDTSVQHASPFIRKDDKSRKRDRDRDYRSREIGANGCWGLEIGQQHTPAVPRLTFGLTNDSFDLRYEQHRERASASPTCRPGKVVTHMRMGPDFGQPSEARLL